MEHPQEGRGRERGRLALPALAGIALLALGAGSFLIGSSLEAPAPPVVGANLPIDRGATSLLDISANNSPSMAQNPTRQTNLVVSNRIDSPEFSCGFNVSTDGGTTWTPGTLPFPAGEELPARCFAPDVTFGPNGTLYVSFVTLKGAGNGPNAVWTVRSVDGGHSFDTPIRAGGPLAFQVRLLADHDRSGRLYLSWLQASQTGLLLFPDTGNPIQMARSDDGGHTWGAPVRVSPASRARALAPAPAQDAGGHLFVLYLDLGDDRLDYQGAHGGRGGEPYQGRWSLVLARSADQGGSWQESVVEGALAPIDRLIVFLPPTPSIAIDQKSGRVYAAFHDARLGDADVYVWSSADDGVSFGRPVRVNDTRIHDGTSQYLPKVAVAPGGRLDVLYYDRRGDRANIRNEVSLQSSTDGGRSFTGRLRLSDQSFDSRVGFGSERNLPDLGSRLALVSTDQRAFGVWTDTRAGTVASSKQDLSGAGVSFTEGSAWRTPLRYAGVGFAALAVLAVVVWLLVDVSVRRRTG